MGQIISNLLLKFLNFYNTIASFALLAPLFIHWFIYISYVNVCTHSKGLIAFVSVSLKPIHSASDFSDLSLRFSVQFQSIHLVLKTEYL